MNKRKDAVVTPQTIRVGQVDPLDLLVTARILASMTSLVSQVRRTRRSETTVNLLHRFIHVPIASELQDIDSLGETVIWLRETFETDVTRYEVPGEETKIEDFYGAEIYQNVRNLVKSRYLRLRDAEQYGPGDMPYLMITAKGIAYLYFHDEIDNTQFKSFLVTGGLDGFGTVTADVSDQYRTDWRLSGNMPSRHYFYNPEGLDSYINHLRGEDGPRFTRNITDAVFSRNAAKAWSALGDLQLDFVRRWMKDLVPSAKMAEVYLTNEVLPHMSQPKKIIKALAEALERDTDVAIAEVEEEILRVAWELLKRAGDKTVGIVDAIENKNQEVLGHLAKLEQQSNKWSGIPGLREQIEDHDQEMAHEIRPYLESSKAIAEANGEEFDEAEMTNRIIRAFDFLESGEPEDVFSPEEWEAAVVQADEFHAENVASGYYAHLREKYSD
jgi:hypothetical protein